MNKEEKKSTHFDRYCVYEKRVPRKNKFFLHAPPLYACIYVDVGMMSKDLRWWTSQVEAAPPHTARENVVLMTAYQRGSVNEMSGGRPRMEPGRFWGRFALSKRRVCRGGLKVHIKRDDGKTKAKEKE